jgi:hypothetical protein
LRNAIVNLPFACERSHLGKRAYRYTTPMQEHEFTGAQYMTHVSMHKPNGNARNRKTSRQTIFQPLTQA